MARSPEQALALYQERAKYYRPMHAAMQEIQNIYDGKTKVDLPEQDQVIGSTVPNLLAQGVDQMAGRISGVTPAVYFGAERPNIRGSVRAASTAKKVLQGWWQMDRLKITQYKRARALIAYGMGPCVIRWDPDANRPCWEVRSPLETFPAPESQTGTCSPADVIFAYRRSVRWLRWMGYDAQIRAVTQQDPAGMPGDSEMTLVEYVDHDGRMLVLTGWMGERGDPKLPPAFMPSGSERAVLLQYAPTDGLMVATVPTRITLSGPQGQFNNMIGMYYTQVRLMALHMAAIEKGIFPDTYLQSRPNEVGRFIDGPHDGRTGRINITAGGQIEQVQSQPSYVADQMIDRIERSERVTAGIPAEFGGESGSNIRTGRRGDAVLSAVIDFPVAECQDVLAYALTDENKIAIAMAKMYDGKAARTIYVGTGNNIKPVTYVADEVFTHDEHVVAYPVSGTDLNSFMIGLGQRVGMGTMSIQTAAELDPFIADAEQEHDRKVKEGLEQALVAGIQQATSQAGAQNPMPPMVLARIMQLVNNDEMELAEALAKVAEDAAAAQQAQQGTESVPPQSADQMSAGPAQQAITGQGSGIGPTPGQADLATLFNTLRKPTREAVPLAAAAQGGV